MTASELAMLTRMPEGLEVSHDGHDGSYIGICVARRSQLLRNILEDTEEGDTFPVPITVDRLNAWRSFRDNDKTALRLPTADMIELLLAADVLIDMKCLEAVCYELSQRLFPRPGPPIQSVADKEDVPETCSEPSGQQGRESAVEDATTDATSTNSGASETIQALESLPDHLALSVMRAVVHLPALLAALPPRLHPAALRAHHPSIDAHNALQLTFPPPDTLPYVVAATAGLSSVTAISIRMRKHGSTFTDAMQPQHFFESVLDTLPNLADVCMEDWCVARPRSATAAPPATQHAARHAAALTRLALRNTSVSMEAVAPRFRTLRTLRVLEVSLVTQGTDDSRPRGQMVSADARALAAHIHELTALEHLSLEQNHVVPEDWVGLAAGLAALPRLRGVNFAGLQLVSDVLFAAPGTGGAAGRGKREAGAGSPAAVAGVWRQMETVNLAGNVVCARKPLLWRALGQMPGLKHLILANVPTQRGVFVHLAQALREGSAARPRTADGDIEGDMRKDGLTGEDMGESCKGGHGSPSDPAAAFQLESVDVSGCRAVWGDAFETCMRAWPGLRRLVAAGQENVPRTVDARMGAAGQGLTAGRAPYLARGLGFVRGLQELVLCGHKDLGADGVITLAPALGGLTALTLLDLSACNARPAGAAALCEQLPRLPRLEVLRVAGNRVGSDGAGRVLEALGACDKVRELDLSRNGVGDGVAVVVKGQLENLKALERVDLRGNVFREAKAVLRAVSMRRGNVLVL